MSPILLSLRAILLLALLSFASFAAHAKSVVSCGGVHSSDKRSLLADPLFTRSPESSALEALKTKKLKAKELTVASQEGLTKAGVQFTVRKFLLGQPLIEIATTGDHVLNKMAARIFEKDQTRLVYDADVALQNLEAMHSPELKRIYVSHNVGLFGKPDASLFHEIKHWSITRKTETGIVQEFDAYFKKFPWSFAPVKTESGYNRHLSFQERSAWIYEAKLSLKSHMKQIEGTNNHPMFTFIEIGERIGGALMVVRDIKLTAQYLKQKIESGSAKVRLNAIGFHTNDRKVSLVILAKGITQIHLPLSSKEQMTTAQARKDYAIKYLDHVIEKSEVDLKNLDEAWLISGHLIHNGTAETYQPMMKRMNTLIED